MPLGTALESSASSGTAWRICRLVTAVVSVGLRPTETPFWLYGLTGMGIVATPRVKFAGGLSTSSARLPGVLSGCTGASRRPPATTFSFWASCRGLPLLKNQAWFFNNGRSEEHTSELQSPDHL